jgi:hypothetical protein
MFFYSWKKKKVLQRIQKRINLRDDKKERYGVNQYFFSIFEHA